MSVPSGPVNVSGTVTGTITFPYSTPPPVPPVPQPLPNLCFLCVRKGGWGMAITVYKATYLCADCVRSLPDEMIINEFPPTP